MTIVEDELWSLTWARRHIDADAMADVLGRALDGRPLDFRSRLLVRDALRGLQEFWGDERFTRWAGERGFSDAINRALSEDASSAGFHDLGERLMQPTTADAVQAYFRDLGGQLRQPARFGRIGRTERSFRAPIFSTSRPAISRSMTARSFIPTSRLLLARKGGRHWPSQPRRKVSSFRKACTCAEMDRATRLRTRSNCIAERALMWSE